MAKSKSQKKEMLENTKDKIERARSIVFAGFKGLGVRENNELRQELKDNSSEYYVAKKTLLDLAIKESGIKGIGKEEFAGNVAAIFGYEDEVAPAKIIDRFMKIKGNEGKIEFLGGVLENKFIGKEQVDDLAKLPAKEELYAKLVGSINAPVSGFVNVLAGNIRALLNVFKAIEEKKA